LAGPGMGVRVARSSLAGRVARSSSVDRGTAVRVARSSSLGWVRPSVAHSSRVARSSFAGWDPGALVVRPSIAGWGLRVWGVRSTPSGRFRPWVARSSQMALSSAERGLPVWIVRSRLVGRHRSWVVPSSLAGPGVAVSIERSRLPGSAARPLAIQPPVVVRMVWCRLAGRWVRRPARSRLLVLQARLMAARRRPVSGIVGRKCRSSVPPVVRLWTRHPVRPVA
jgi:hypothetical protein